MFVSQTDKHLLDGDFTEPPVDGAWLTRHLPPEARPFVFYYLKMKPLLSHHGLRFFLDACRDHTGTVCSRKTQARWVKLLLSLEEAARKAHESSDLQKLSELKLGTRNINSEGTEDEWHSKKARDRQKQDASESGTLRRRLDAGAAERREVAGSVRGRFPHGGV